MGKCNGGYECRNPDCHDICGDGGKNATAFLITRDRKGKHSEVTCRLCAESQFVFDFPCSMRKIVTLPEGSVHAYVAMEGSHNATCSGFRKKKDTSGVIWKLHELINPGTKQVFVFLIYYRNMYLLNKSDNKRYPHHVMWKLVNYKYTYLLHITQSYVHRFADNINV